MVEIGGLKRCSRTEGYSKQFNRREAETCATMFNKGYMFNKIDESAPVYRFKKEYQIFNFPIIR